MRTRLGKAYSPSRGTRTTFAVFCLTGVLGLGLGSVACAPPPTEAPQPHPEVVLHGVHMKSYRANSIAALGEAKLLIYERGSSNAELEKAVLKLPPRPGQGAGNYSNLGGVQIIAPRADGNLNAQKLEAYGGVEARSVSGMVAKTERAQFDGVAFQTTGAGPIFVRAPNYALDAVGFSLRSREEEFEFGGPLRSGVKGAH